MSGFQRNFKYITTFDGDNVEFTLTGLSRKDVILLTPLFEKVSKNITDEEANNIANTFMDVAKPHVVSMVGLKDGEGNAIDVDTMLSEQYFFSLSGEVVNHLMEKSNPVIKKEDEKKLPESLPITSIQAQGE